MLCAASCSLRCNALPAPGLVAPIAGGSSKSPYQHDFHPERCWYRLRCQKPAQEAAPPVTGFEPEPGALPASLETAAPTC